MAEIASLAEFSVGAVYGFFADKDDLFAQVCLRRGAEFMDGMRAALGSERSPRERMHDLADFQVAFFREHAAFARLFLRTAGPVIGPLGASEGTVAGNYTEAMALQADLFRSGTAAGELRAGDPEVLASMFSGMVAAYQASDPGVADTEGAAAPDAARRAARHPRRRLRTELARRRRHGRRCCTATPCSVASRSAISERWHASGSRSTHSSAPTPPSGSSSTIAVRSTGSRISRV